MAMMNLPNLTQAQAQQALLPGQIAQQQTQVAQGQLGLRSTLEKQQIMDTLGNDPGAAKDLSPRQLAYLGPETAGPILKQYHDAEGRIANQRNAATMVALSQTPQYAGTPAGNWMMANAASLSNAPDYVDPDKLYTSLSKHELDKADEYLKAGQGAEAQAQAQIGIPAQAASAYATAGKTGAETQFMPEEVATRRMAAEADVTRAQAEWQKEMPGGSSAQQRINAVVSQYERSNVVPRLMSLRPDTQQQFADNEYQDLRNVGASHEVAIQKVRQLVPDYGGPTGPLPSVPGGAPPSAAPGTAAGAAGAGGAPPSMAPSQAGGGIPNLPQGGTHYAVGPGNQILGWAGPDGQVHPFQ
jgi:hypothetical protein